MSEDGILQLIEFFIASDASAMIEHTKCVLYLEDDDIAHIADGELHIHCLRHNNSKTLPATRSIETLELELAEIMKGKFYHFMQNSQSESTNNTEPSACSMYHKSLASSGPSVGALLVDKQHFAEYRNLCW